MPVVLTIAKTLTGAAVADALAGGGSGVDIGPVVNGEYGPLINKIANTGWQDLYLSHDAAVDPITNVKTYIDEFSQTYGGADSAANDFAALQAKGAASGNSANNADGLSAGFRVEHDWQISGASAFDGTRAQVKIYGKAGLGVSLATAYDLHVDAMSRNNAGVEVDATTPVTGKIGKAGDTVLGDRAHLKTRLYLEQGATQGGLIQWDWVVAYAYTA